MKECNTGVVYVYHHDPTYPDPLKKLQNQNINKKNPKTIVQQTYILLTVD